MSDTSFVRSGMLPPQIPPVSERGAVKWLRENLFSSIFNSILTLVGLLVVVSLAYMAVPWFLNGVWNANSLQECRDIVAASAGPDASGACWAMVRERWHQFLFGFYPSDLYWRPVLAMGLLLISLAPVLYFGQRRANTILVGTVSVLTFIVLALLDKSSTHLAIFGAMLIGLTALAWFAPKRLLILTIAFPLLGFWLLWGGSIWGPVAVALGFALLVAVFRMTRVFLGDIVASGIGVLAAGIYWLFLQGNISTGLGNGHLVWVLLLLVAGIPLTTTILSSSVIADDRRRGLTQGAALFGWLAISLVNAPFLEGFLPLGTSDALALRSVGSDEFGGFLLAFVIGVTAIGASLPIGILLALGRRSDMLLIKSLCVGFIEFVRGVPLITVLFTATLLLGYFLPPQSNFDVVLRVIILVTFFAAAYMAEVIRGGLAALPRGQYEAADALGLDYWQAQRLIIMPQALKVSIPGIVSSFIGLFKDTTLVAFVGLMDPLKGVTTIVRADTNWKGIYWEPYILVGAIFFVVCFGMSRYSMYLERKLKTDHR